MNEQIHRIDRIFFTQVIKSNTNKQDTREKAVVHRHINVFIEFRVFGNKTV